MTPWGLPQLRHWQVEEIYAQELRCLVIRNPNLAMIKEVPLPLVKGGKKFQEDGGRWRDYNWCQHQRQPLHDEGTVPFFCLNQEASLKGCWVWNHADR